MKKLANWLEHRRNMSYGACKMLMVTLIDDCLLNMPVLAKGPVEAEKLQGRQRWSCPSRNFCANTIKLPGHHDLKLRISLGSKLRKGTDIVVYFILHNVYDHIIESKNQMKEILLKNESIE